MEKLIEQIDGIIAELDGMPDADKTPFIQIASGRFLAGKRRIEEHLAEVKKREEAKAKAIADKEAELATMKGGKV
jgi:hypothetical protein